jgi:hypothetical protein
VCGTVFEGDEWYEGELRRRVAEPDLAGRAALRRVRPPDDAVLARTPVVLVPSRVEPLGNTAVEAMLAQRPLVASRVQGLAEIVEDGRTRLLVPPGDPAALVVFGDRDSGAYLLKFAWTKITRHTMVKGWASPDDPALASYWAARRRHRTRPVDPARLRLLQHQRGRCPLCGELLLHADQEPRHPDEWEQWIKAVRVATRHQAITLGAAPGKPGGPAVYRLTHTHCTRRHPGGTSGGPAALTGTPAGLA